MSLPLEPADDSITAKEAYDNLTLYFHPLRYSLCFNTPQSFDVDESYDAPRTATQAQFARERRDPEPLSVWTRMSTVSGQNQRSSYAPPSPYSEASSSSLLR